MGRSRMEEVDQIIIHGLRSICDIDADTRSVNEFESATLFQAVVKCLQVIEPEKEIKTSLGKGMSGRVSACAEAAQRVKELGYKGDLGYHQLLYPNTNDTRNLLNFLTSKLPRTEQEQSSTSAEVGADSSELLKNAIVSKFNTLVKETWSPIFDPLSIQQVYHSKSNFFTSAIDDSFEENADFVTRQPPRRKDVIPSLLEHNFAHLLEEIQLREEWESAGLDSGLNPTQFRQQKRLKIAKQMGQRIRYSVEESEAAFAAYAVEKEKEKASRMRKANRFTNLVDYTQEETSTSLGPKESEEDIKKRREEELAELEEQMNNLKLRLEQVKKDMENFQTGIRQSEASIINEDKKYDLLKERYRIDKKVFEELLPDAANNIRLLQEISQKSAAQLMELAREWENHRSKLIEAYRKLKAQHINRKGGTADLLTNIKEMRQQMKDLESETAKKDERFKELLEVYRQLPKNINRSVYTNRILEIVKQVKKQKVDISKILLDNRNLQKEINQAVETLGRTFTVANEMIYLDAKEEKKGENAAKTSFKLLVSIHNKYKALADKVGELGTATNQVLDLSDKLSQVTQRAGDLDLERVEADLEQIKQENKTLMKKLSNF